MAAGRIGMQHRGTGLRHTPEPGLPETTYDDYTKLQNPGCYKTFIPGDGLYATNTELGYAGIVIFRDFEGKLHCCDLACPVEASRTTRVTVNASLEATCPKCGSVFQLGWGLATLPRTRQGGTEDLQPHHRQRHRHHGVELNRNNQPAKPQYTSALFLNVIFHPAMTIIQNSITFFAHQDKCRTFTTDTMAYKLLVMDLDGTLTNTQKVITPQTMKALTAAQEAGVRLVLASGPPHLRHHAAGETAGHGTAWRICAVV